MKETLKEREILDDYYSRKGADRNDVLSNAGVLFQMLAMQRSVIEALRFLPINKDTSKILDIGCAGGGSLVQFLSYGFDPTSLYGVDIIPERITEGKRRFPNINFLCGDATHLQYESQYFDLVVESTMFLQMTDDDLRARIANEMLRVVKPSGYIMLCDWRYSIGHPDYKSLSRSRIARLFQVGKLTAVTSRKHGALVPPLGRFMSRYSPSFYFFVSRVCPFLVGQITTVLQRNGTPIAAGGY
jgi:ubiquinone/menaquinone biosynthesis C-methylase UbiE